jgi:hypothetical protein
MTVLARLPSSRLGPWSGQGLRPRLPFPRIQGASRGRVLLSWRTFTVSRPLQPGIRLLRRLRPPAHTLALSRPAAGPVSWEFPSSGTRDVIVTGSCLLYAGRIRDNTERCVGRSAPRHPFWVGCLNHFHPFNITTPTQVPVRQHRSQDWSVNRRVVSRCRTFVRRLQTPVVANRRRLLRGPCTVVQVQLLRSNLSRR